jgi:hypothetical protein
VLVELCIRRNPKTLDEIVNFLSWAPGLKRDIRWKRQRVADEMRSMIERKIPLPRYILSILGDEGKPRFGFNEIAFATAQRRLSLSWIDFKEQQQIDARFVCVKDSEDEHSTAGEGFDYGSVPMARVAALATTPTDLETVADLHIVGASLGPQISDIMESMHTAQPRDGYRPIAWHNVFWEVVSEYEALLLVLEQRIPFCDTDQELADHVAVNYLDVVGTSRPSINRRRTRLYNACEELIHTRIRERLAVS